MSKLLKTCFMPRAVPLMKNVRGLCKGLRFFASFKCVLVTFCDCFFFKKVFDFLLICNIFF